MATKPRDLNGSHPSAPAQAPLAETSLEARWGDIILDAGHTAIPNLLLELYTELGISNHEMMFIIHIFNYRWSKKNPYPALQTIATKMGATRRNVRRYVSRLKTMTYQTDEEKEAEIQTMPFLVVKERYRTDQGQLSNLYDFSGLTAAVIKLALAKGLVIDPALEANADPPSDKIVLPPSDKNVLPPRTKTSAKKEISKKKTSKKERTPSSSRSGSAAKPEGNGRNIAATAIGNAQEQEVHRLNAEPMSIGTIIQGRIAQLTAQSKREQPTLPNGFTEEEDAIALYIETFSFALGDEAHTTSNVTQAINLYYAIRRELPELTLNHYLYLLEAFKDVVRIRKNVKKKGAYYFTCLRNALWNQEQGYTMPTRADGYGLWN